MHQTHGPGQQQNHGLGLLNGNGFGGQLAENHMQQGDDTKAHGHGNGRYHGGVAEADELQRRAQHLGHRRFTQPAQAEAGQGNAQLANRQIGVQMGNAEQRALGPFVAARGQQFQLRFTHFDKGELGRHEKTVQTHQ